MDPVIELKSRTVAFRIVRILLKYLSIEVALKISSELFEQLEDKSLNYDLIQNETKSILEYENAKFRTVLAAYPWFM